MDQVIKKALATQRKNKREIAELKELKTRILALKAPDQTMLAKIDEELKKLTA